MIFRIKHHWALALVVTIVIAAATWLAGAWSHIDNGRFSWWAQVAIGLGGGLAALAINAVLHETFRRTIGDHYLRTFAAHGRAVLDGMHWPAYLAGALMAAVAEEPLFRGLLLPAFASPAVGVAVAALVFAACHWMRLQFLPFWFWAMWEGVLLGLLMVFTGSLLAPMIAHGLHDLVAYRVFAVLVRDGSGQTV